MLSIVLRKVYSTVACLGSAYTSMPNFSGSPAAARVERRGDDQPAVGLALIFDFAGDQQAPARAQGADLATQPIHHRHDFLVETVVFPQPIPPIFRRICGFIHPNYAPAPRGCSPVRQAINQLPVSRRSAHSLPVRLRIHWRKSGSASSHNQPGNSWRKWSRRSPFKVLMPMLHGCRLAY